MCMYNQPFRICKLSILIIYLGLIAINGVVAAIVIKTVFEKYQIPVKVKLLDTPIEEDGGGGKILIIKAGAYDNVDVFLMVHPR
ncbi:hypothetical protein RCL_jg19862.t1 [Rhizophagus clarus]|uniref:Uncharacterized protein n=1 Tax=Rhizophagus clarus TaxID=94130 RepID=A0A8H3LAI1_9GLOM|nr:hypothetical protein RCL_jg19862.t1 [Rhizophagus clarus]